MAFEIIWLAPVALIGGIWAVGAGKLSAPAAEAVARGWLDDRWEQVRSRIIVRVTPLSGNGPRTVLQGQEPVRLRREKGEPIECVRLAEVAGVRLDEAGRLLVFMRDNGIYSAAFERSCSVQVFYSGFYVERPRDGKLCAGRDQLHARSGSDCKLGRFDRMAVAD
jgi:hypothetical protein